MVRIEEAVEVLERTPQALRSLLAGLSDPWLAADEGPDSFDAVDVVGHLIHGEETDWIPRLHIILEHGESHPFTPFDRFAFRTKYAGWSLPRLLDRFAEARRDNLAELRALALQPAQLELCGTHPELGSVTLGQLLATWVTHDLTHLAQIARVMAKRFQAEVGPWRAYIRILQ